MRDDAATAEQLELVCHVRRHIAKHLVGKLIAGAVCAAVVELTKSARESIR